MTILENTIDKIDKLDLNFHLKYEVKTILFDHILKEIENDKKLLNSAPNSICFDAKEFVNKVCDKPETINHKP